MSHLVIWNFIFPSKIFNEMSIYYCAVTIKKGRANIVLIIIFNLLLIITIKTSIIKHFQCYRLLSQTSFN